jgi:hypothetical protein
VDTIPTKHRPMCDETKGAWGRVEKDQFPCELEAYIYTLKMPLRRMRMIGLKQSMNDGAFGIVRLDDVGQIMNAKIYANLMLESLLVTQHLRSW